MSTDSSELTFVRCPSCRSLVPAMSTRCRMCGAALEVGAKADDGDKEKKATRIRQRTMSESAPDDVSEALNRVREEPPAPPAPAAAATTNGTEAHTPTIDDPLADYIEEVEVAEPPKKISAAMAAPPPLPDPVVETPAPAPKPSVAMFSPPGAGAASPVEESAEAQQRVIVESGARKANKPSALSFNKPKSEQKEARSEPAPLPKQAPAAREQREDRVEQEPTRAKQREVPPAPSREKQPQQPRAVGGAERGKGMAGRLFGWLVSYRIAEGHAVELREGKFFVTQSSLKEHDLVLEDDSVSTPHALITVSLDQGLMVQDLMSERGVHVRRRREDGYQRIAESEVLRHGDWVRFGDVEFLVSLIAHVGER
ncbi:MAG: FHA domain-containing protein [Bdellovibrionota bacterium]|nr:MAG: FHA domain-containing protein [Bdellovibrionota bacterium]